MTQDRYKELGVSAHKEGVHRATANLQQGLFPGAFCKILPESSRYVGCRTASIPHVDGVGTKGQLAYLVQKRHRVHRSHLWPGIAQDALAMNLNDMACVGAVGDDAIIDVVMHVARNSFRFDDNDLACLIDGCRDIVARLNDQGVKIRYAVGETADTPDLTRTVDVHLAAFTRMKRSRVIDASRMRPGDVIIGFSSTGRAHGEDQPNSGVGSNGFTATRHELLSPMYRRDRETFAPELAQRKKQPYRGAYTLDETPDGLDVPLWQALLSPTRIYVPLITELIASIGPKDIHGLIHCTGGGQTKIGKFGREGNLYIKDSLFPTPPIFQLIKTASKMSDPELYKTFNMGHMLEAVLPQRLADTAIRIAHGNGIDAQAVGFVGSGVRGKRVVKIDGEWGQHSYQFAC